MKFIFKYMLRHKRFLIINIFAVITIAVAELGIPMVIGSIVDKGLPQSDYKYVYQMSLILLAVAIVGIIGNLLLNYCATKTSTLILKDLRKDIFSKAQTFSPLEMQKFGTSSLITRTTSDVFQILNFVSTFYRSAIMAPAMIIFSIIIILIKTPTLVTSLFIVVPLIIIVIGVIGTISRGVSTKQQLILDKLNLITRENVTGVRVIRAFRKSNFEANRFKGENERFTKNTIKLFYIMTSMEPIFYFLLNMGIVYTLWFGGQAIFHVPQTVTLGGLIEFMDYQFQILFSILIFSNLFIMYPRSMVSVRRIKEVLDLDVSIKNNDKALTQVEKTGELQFDHVSFQFEDSEKAVLTDIDFTIKTGETVAFIGSTGSGKSTLINLIPRLFDVHSGAIKLDGVDVRDYDLTYLRSRVAMILQKAILFKGTIIENMRYGKHDATIEEIVAACKIAQAHDFIMNKPDQYLEMISELGANFSGGQKQRLSIARAIIKNADVYIFDDSFSALDYKTDANLRKALYDFAQDKILIIVAQRIATITNADRIFVMHEGHITDSGTHEELMNRSKIYQEIAYSQLSKEELEI